MLHELCLSVTCAPRMLMSTHQKANTFHDSSSYLSMCSWDGSKIPCWSDKSLLTRMTIVFSRWTLIYSPCFKTFKMSYSDRCFVVAASKAWNELPLFIRPRTSSSVEILKKQNIIQMWIVNSSLFNLIMLVLLTYIVCSPISIYLLLL